jgi:hypothetical protein
MRPRFTYVDRSFVVPFRHRNFVNLVRGPGLFVAQTK